ncbi:MAG TPA: TonB-dependent receptor [Candidatus Dormibacteraeota bacterium]|nr:TonB-dependent receptor [Candidatus Dormibacteraeota bacterium]
MKRKDAFAFITSLAIGLLLGCAAYAQIKSGTIIGKVTDPSGSAIAGALVSVINQDTNVATATNTDETGDFTVPYLPPGTYTANVEKPGSGFAKYSTKGVSVATAQTVKIEVTLKIGPTEQIVSVSADAVALQTSNATVQSIVSERAIEALPNIAHNAFAYAALQPGVVPRGLFNDTQTTSSFGIGIDGRRQASAVGINGGAAFSNDVILDGVSIQGSAWNESAVLPNQDALQEVRTITNNYSAEYGRAQGAVIFTTKSGGDNYHGAAHYRLRNEALNGNSFFNNAKNITRGPFKSNTFGGSFGGRIIRDKAFFFVSYEGLRFHRGYDYLLTVPTDAERVGDFSKTFANIYDPFRATKLPGNSYYTRSKLSSDLRTVPGLVLNPFGLALLNAYPHPNRSPENVVFNRNNFFLRGNQAFTKNVVNSRVDYHLGKRQYFYGTYGLQKGNIRTPRSWGADNQFYSQKEFVGNQQPDNNYYFAVGDTVVLSPRLVLDVRAGVNRIQADNEADVFPSFNYDQFGIPKEIQALNAIPGAPLEFNPPGNVSGLNFAASLHKRERQTNTDLNGSMTWTRGRWNHKVGGNYRVLLSNYIDVDNSVTIQTSPDFTRQTINADGTTNGLPTLAEQDRGLSMASILLGAGNLNVTGRFAIRLALAQKYYALYSQNDWRVTDRLTFNLGLRWDVQPGPTERFNRITSIDLNSKEPFMGTPGAIVFPGNTRSSRHLWQTEYHNFGPRLGAALQVRRSLVVRGGYGVTYVPSNTGFNDGPGFYGGTPFGISAVGLPYGTTPAGVPVGAFNSPAVNQIVGPIGPNPLDPRIYGGERRFPYDYKNGYVQQWNFFLEQKLGPDWIVSAGYIGSHGGHLQVAYVPINSPQLIDPQLLDSWRNTYVGSNGTTNPSTQQVCSPFQTLQTCVSNPNGTFKSATGPLVPYGFGNIRSRSIQRLDANFPYPLEGDNIHLSVGSSDYHALQLQVTRQFAGGLQLSGHYTFSKLMAMSRYNAQTNQGYSDGGANNYFPYLRPESYNLNRQITTNDVPHRVAVNWVYELPLGSGKHVDPHQAVLNAFVGGWGLAGSFTAQSGFVAPLSNGGTNSINTLPDRDPLFPLEVPQELQRWYDGKTTIILPSGRLVTPCNGCFLKYNIDAFKGRTVTTPNGKTVADILWYGTAAPSYGGIRSSSIWNVNISLEKSFKMRERYSLNFSAQATNLFNHTQFKPGINTSFGPTVVTADPTLGLKVGQLQQPAGDNTFGTYRQNAYDARQLELVMQFRF